MKFTCEKALLVGAAAISSRAVSSKSTIPALEGLLLRAEDGMLSISGYDLEIGIKTDIPAQTTEPGCAVLNARIFSDIIRRLPDDIVSVQADDRLAVKISCRTAEFDIIATPAEDFPDFPAVDSEKSITLPQGVLKSMISQTVFATSTNDAKPILTGSLFDVAENSLRVVSIDGNRLAVREERVSHENEARQFSFVVPGPTLREAEKILAESEDPVTLTLSKKHIIFTLGDTILISRLLEGEFFKYENALPKSCDKRVSVNIATLTESIERVSILISEKVRNSIRCVFEDGVIRLSAVTAIGRAYDSCYCEGDGKDTTIGFTSRFLLDALRSISDEEAVLEFSSSLSPLLIKPKEGRSYLHLIAAVRLRDNEV